MVFRHSSKDQSLTPQTQSPLLISCTANVQSKWARILKTKVRLISTSLSWKKKKPLRWKTACCLTEGFLNVGLQLVWGVFLTLQMERNAFLYISPRFPHPGSNRSRWQLLNSPSASFILSGSRVPAHTTASNISNACRESHVELPVTPNYSEQHAR